MNRIKQLTVIRSAIGAFTEPLERRVLLAVTAHISSRGTLLITGDANANVITVGTDDANMLVVTADGAPTAFDPASVRRIYIDGGDGDDQLTVNVKRNSNLVGGNGNDTLTGGAGNDTMTGGDGDDTADYYSRDRGFAFHLGAAGLMTGALVGDSTARSGDEFDDLGSFETIIGTIHKDRFAIDETHVTVEARGGNDIFSVLAPAGFSALFGGNGDDYCYVADETTTSFYGGSGNDICAIDGNASPNFDGGRGTDVLDISDSWVTVVDLNYVAYESVENVIANSAGSDGYSKQIIGTAGPNLIDVHGLVGPNTIIGGAGNDTIIGSTGYVDEGIPGERNDSIDGGEGNDSIEGGAGNDTIHGGAGNDTLVGNRGHDKIFGDAGDDRVYARDNLKDTLDGGDGSDTADRDSIDDVRNIESFI